jgi:hypothetical protein
MKEYTITFTIRPMRWLKSITMAAILAVGTVMPLPGTKLVEAEPALPPSPQVVARMNAYATVTSFLRTKITWMPPEQIAEAGRVVVDEALENGLDPLLALAVVETESHWDNEAVSVYQRQDGSWAANARGLMQVIPSTWEMECKRRGLGKLNKFNPIHNLKIGIGYLGYLSKGFKRLDSLALAYNQGPGGAMAIIKEDAIPSAEAEAYPGIVIAHYTKILKNHGLDSKKARQLFRQPQLTVLRAEGGALQMVAQPEPPRRKATVVASNP